MNIQDDNKKLNTTPWIEFVKIGIIILIILLFLCLIFSFFNKPKETIQLKTGSPSEIYLTAIPGLEN